MSPKAHMETARPGDMLLAIHDFKARSEDELTLARGDRIELLERDDDFGDGWFLGKHLGNGTTGLFPEVYTTLAPKGTRTKPVEPATLALNGTAASNGAALASDALSGSPGLLPTADSSKQKTSRASDSALASQMQSTDAPSPTTQRTSLPVSKVSANAYPGESATNPVMNETLSVIEEHMTEMNTPRHSTTGRRLRSNRSTDGMHNYNGRIERIDHINGEETDEEENARFTEADVLSWSPAKVAKQLEAIGVEKHHCDIFREQEISGEVLLSMDQSAVFLKEFDLGPVGRRLKTWHKIRQLQIDIGETKHATHSVSDYSMVGAPVSESGRDRSASAVAPMSHGHSNSTDKRFSTRSQGLNTQSPQPLFQNDSETTLGSSRMDRPSAASVRHLNQSRRHSSIEALDSPVKTSSSAVPSPTRTTHNKQGSFDRAWTMIAGHRSSTSEPNSAVGRPMSTARFPPSSPDMSSSTAAVTTAQSNTSALDVDRGYFSGNDVDRRSSRNVLRKYSMREGTASAQHSRTSSFASAWRRRSGSTNTTLVNPDNNDGSLSSPPKSYSARFRGKRSASGPEIRPNISEPQPLSSDYPPTVTKLEYGNAHSIDAVAVSPNPTAPEASPVVEKAPVLAPQQSAMASIFGKSRSPLRAISDTVMGHDKHITTSPVEMSKDSQMYSPVRTGSSTHSGTSKSFEIDDSVMGKTSTTSSSGIFSSVPIPAPPRRKTKKTTSAYTRGLMTRTPAEQIAECDYSGWMKKKSGNVMATWKPRLFVLRGRRLSYYYSDTDTEEKGLIDISNHRVLPANDEKLVGLHATLTGATASPTSPHHATTPTTASADAAKLASSGVAGADTSSGTFIFKLVPPREGLSKAVNFTRPTVHYFAVDNLAQGRLWMAALMKATIDRDDTKKVVTSYNQPTISLAKAKAMKHRPPALMPDEEGGGSSVASLAGTETETEVERRGGAALGGAGNKGNGVGSEGLGLSMDGQGDALERASTSSNRPSFVEIPEGMGAGGAGSVGGSVASGSAAGGNGGGGGAGNNNNGGGKEEGVSLLNA